VFLLIDAYNNYTPQGTKFQRVYIIGITLSVCPSICLSAILDRSVQFVTDL